MGKKWPEMVVKSPTNSFVLFLNVQTLAWVLAGVIRVDKKRDKLICAVTLVALERFNQSKRQNCILKCILTLTPHVLQLS